MGQTSSEGPSQPRPEERERAAIASGMRVYKNEFAMVAVGHHETSSGSRLHLVDLASGGEVFLDPMELEGLTRARHTQFAPLLDPSFATSEGEPDPDQV